MSYYQGDFYQGDFYRGDPGFFSFLGGLAKGVIGSFLPGVGATAAAPTAITKVATGMQRMRPIVQRAGAMIAKHPVISAAAGAGTIGALGAGVRGARSRMGGKAAAMNGGVRKRRRMHVTNVRALRRAIRRCSGFAHLAKRVLRFTSPRPPRGRVTFKHARRKRTV